MPSFTNSYTEPGTYVVINDDVLTQTNTGLLSVCIIGAGKTTKSINNVGLELVPPKYVLTNFIINNPDNFGTQVTPLSDVSAWEVTTYAVGDFVKNSSKYYVCNTAHTPESDTTFNDDIDNWTEILPLEDYYGQELQANTYIIFDTNIYKCILKIDVPEDSYPEWQQNTYYTNNDFVKYSDSYFNCIESHTSVNTTPTGEYWKKYWKEVSPEDSNWSAEIPNSDIYPVLEMYKPTQVVGGITTKVYDNNKNPDGTDSDSPVYFDIEDESKLVWIYTELPETDRNAQGRYVLTMSYVANKVASVDGKIKSFTRLSNIFNTYGAPSAENTISSAAQIAYDNGATVFYCVQPLETGDTDENNTLTVNGLKNGLMQAQTVDTYCVIPMLENTDDTNIASLCKTHVEKMSSTLERKERVCIISGAYREEASMDDITESIEYYKSTAAAINSPRMIYVTPSSVIVNLDGENVPGSGMYAAAALAGIICNNSFTCGEPITGKTLADVSINDKYTREEKNQLASYGCLVLEGAEGTTVPKIRHALSTATGDYVKSEVKITKIKDVISSTLRLALDRAYINTRFLGASTISEMTTTVNTILSSFLANNDIYSYNNLVIAQDQNYPNQVNVSFRIAPAVDLNYILVTFGVTFQE